MTKTKDIRAAVEAELSFDPRVDATGITVKNLNGEVALDGTVPSYPQYLEAAAANSQMLSLKQLLDLAEESLRLTLLRYQAGEVTVLEVVDAQTTLLQARNAYDEGMVRYRLGLANLQTLTGAF